jgi:hypothetical protein
MGDDMGCDVDHRRTRRRWGVMIGTRFIGAERILAAISAPACCGDRCKPIHGAGRIAGEGVNRVTDLF